MLLATLSIYFGRELNPYRKSFSSNQSELITSEIPCFLILFNGLIPENTAIIMAVITIRILINILVIPYNYIR